MRTLNIIGISTLPASQKGEEIQDYEKRIGSFIDDYNRGSCSKKPLTVTKVAKRVYDHFGIRETGTKRSPTKILDKLDEMIEEKKKTE